MALKAKIKISKKQIIIIAVAIITAIAVCICAAVVVSNSRDAVYYDFGKDIANGYDLSEHNGDIDWTALKEEVDFVFIRVGYRGYGTGEICEDENFKENIKGARNADIPFGVYFYSQATTAEEAQEEAEFVIKKVRRYQVDLPLIIDFEYATDEQGDYTGRLWEAGLSSDECTQIISAFCQKVTKHNFMAGVYASSSLYDTVISQDTLADDTVIWVADYNEKVTTDTDYHIWQYSRTGESDSIESSYVDLNYWYSTKQ